MVFLQLALGNPLVHIPSLLIPKVLCLHLKIISVKYIMCVYMLLLS
jgi:hypothetical protein